MRRPRRILPSGATRCRGRGRERIASLLRTRFTEDELEVVRGLVSSLPTRRAIADAVCDELPWLRPDRRRKDMSARVALLRMERDGLVVLPPPRNGNGNIARHGEAEAHLSVPIPVSLQELDDISLVVVDTKVSSRHWRSLVASYHYLGYTPFAGAQLRYLIETSFGTIGALGFAASAWTCAPRDTHIGWDSPTRAARLHLVVGNARFLIVPEVRPEPGLSRARTSSPAPTARLERCLRVYPGAPRDLRRDRPVYRGELQGGELNLRRQDQRTRQARPGQPPRAPRQRRLSLPAAPRLSPPAQLTGASRLILTADGVEALRRLGRTPRLASTAGSSKWQRRAEMPRWIGGDGHHHRPGARRVHRGPAPTPLGSHDAQLRRRGGAPP